MKTITREFMRGRFEILSSVAQKARELFEDYISEEDISRKKELRKSLLKILQTLRTHHEEVSQSLQEAFDEDSH